MQIKADEFIKNLHKNNKKTYIIHGIGTDCGKTHTLCFMLDTLNKKSKKNFVIKPIITGFEEQNYHLSDNFKLLSSAMQKKPSIDEVISISQYVFPNPLSPDIASWKSKFEINFEKIILFCKSWQEKAQNEEANLFIETAGGICSPCSNFHTMADISKTLAITDVENILISTPYLGAISHTISALHILKFQTLIINRCEDDFLKSIKNHLPYEIEIVCI